MIGDREWRGEREERGGERGGGERGLSDFCVVTKSVGKVTEYEVGPLCGSALTCDGTAVVSEHAFCGGVSIVWNAVCGCGSFLR